MGKLLISIFSETIKYPKDDHSCFSIDIFDSLAQDYLDSLERDPLETTITKRMGLKTEGVGEDKTHSMHVEFHAVPTCEDEAEMVAALESLP